MGIVGAVTVVAVPIRIRRGIALSVLSVLALASCGGDDGDTAEAVEASTTSSAPKRTTTTRPRPTTTAAASTTTVAATTPPTAAPVTAPPADPPPPPPPAAPAAPAPYSPVAGYSGVVGPIDAGRLTASWRAGCPVGPENLRLLTLPYVGYDGGNHTGELVVHADVADAVTGVFAQLHGARFPIARMELVDVYGGDDDRSTMANNTSAFNCRAITGGGRWSEHAYGRAIDINPVENPYVYSDGHVLDPAAAPYTDRNRNDPGMIKAGDTVVSAFGAIGWGWGGNFSSIKDYQHFSASGR